MDDNNTSKEESTQVKQDRFSFIAELTEQLHHLPGSQNIVADALSRAEEVTAEPITVKQLRDGQLRDDEVNAMKGVTIFHLVEIKPGTRLV